MNIEHIFERLGSSMANIKFEDLNVDYVTSNFKDLLTAIEEANTAISVGMQKSFQGAIADSEKLQKVFADMKIDPKKMGMEEVRSALDSHKNNLKTELDKAWEAADKLHSKMAQLTSERKQLEQK